MQLDSLHELYVNELKDLYSAETQLVKALPKLAKASSHPKLAKAFNTHLKQTERHVQRLERIFRDLDETPRGKKCVGMQALIEEGQELIREKPEPDVLDAGLISKAQHVEHYEIAGYGTVRTWAQELGEDKHADLLQQTLDEEYQANDLLTELAESTINIEAEQEEDEEAMTAQGARGTRSTRRGRSATTKKGASKRGTGRSTSRTGPRSRGEVEVSRPAATEAGGTAEGRGGRGVGTEETGAVLH